MTIALPVLGNRQPQLGKAQPHELVGLRNLAGAGSHLVFLGGVGGCRPAAVSFDLPAARFSWWTSRREVMVSDTSADRGELR